MISPIKGVLAPALSRLGFKQCGPESALTILLSSANFTPEKGDKVPENEYFGHAELFGSEQVIAIDDVGTPWIITEPDDAVAIERELCIMQLAKGSFVFDLDALPR